MLSLFIGMLGFILVAVFIANGNFLEKYYIHNKEQVLTQIYTCLLYTSPSPRDRG